MYPLAQLTRFYQPVFRSNRSLNGHTRTFNVVIQRRNEVAANAPNNWP
jgi:hypothetical protein